MIKTCLVGTGSARSERFDYHQNDDDGRQNPWDFIQHPQIATRQLAFPARQCGAIPGKPYVIGCEAENEGQFGMKPSLTERPDRHGQSKPQDPYHDQRWPKNDLEQLTFPIDPFRIFGGAGLALLMVDEIAWEHEQPGHPEQHENNMAGLEPEIRHGKQAGK